MPNKVALNAVMATLAAAMRHSPAFDILAEARGRGSNSISGVDWCGDFRFILHLFLGWMSLLADKYQR
jgi:hypothetical protein